MIGKILSGRYRIEERIDAGGMAVVYRGQDQLLHRTVAIKVLNPAHLHDEDCIRKFRREARSAASLSHFNIVSVYDVGEEDDIYYIVMEFIDGKTLKELIRQEGTLPVSVALEIARQICDALEHAHQKGIVHRDIKPQNILITGEGHVKVTDFGIARAVSSGTVTRGDEIFGSVHYFSPEQARGGVVNEKSDIYSLGVVMYEMLTGRVPFTGSSPISIAVKHLQAEPEPPRKLDPTIPVEVERIILKAMQRDEALRYPSASSLKRDLESALRRVTKKESLRALLQQDHEQTLKVAPLPEDEGGRSLSKKSKKDRRKKKKTSWFAKFLIAVLILMALGAAAGFFFLRSYFSVPEVIVPNVVGLSLTEASSRLDSQGLDYEIVATEWHDSIPANYVISQNPEAERKVKAGRIIDLVLSKGPLVLEVPNVVGMEERNATIELFNAGFEVGTKEYINHETVPKGHVIEQNPHPQAKVQADTKINLVISAGPPIVEVTVPSLIGRSPAEALAILQSIGLKLGEVVEQNADLPSGQIVAQEPAAESVVEVGTAVNVVVSKGPETIEPGTDDEGQTTDDEGSQEDNDEQTSDTNIPPGV